MADTPFTAVDLSRLPAPAIVDALDYETIRAAMIADLVALCAVAGVAFDATVESDPAVKLIEVAAMRELLIRARVNDAAKAVMVAYATGADLDNLASLFTVARLTITPANADTNTPAVMESDADLRRRLVLAPEGYSVAGPEGAYIFHALSADAGVADASATSPEAGTVVVTLLGRAGDGSVSPALVATVAAYLTADTRRPLTDNVVVQSASIIGFAIAATITTFAGPDSSIVLATSRAQLDAYLAESAKLGRDVTRSGIIAALTCPGVQNVLLANPAADVVVDRTQAADCTGVTITYGGLGE